MQPSVADQLWDRYEPDTAVPWNLRRVVHLHRRAGFAATWTELQRDLKDGPKASIDRLLAGKSRLEGVPKDFDSTAAMLVHRAVEDGDVNRLKAWWMYRMLFGPDPLGERLTLMWHNHFATSAAKVGFAVRSQNEIEREFAKAPFGRLLNQVLHDSALLLWLDAQANGKGHPNENLSRELMELFTLGIGHFEESDVKEAARALTGWTVVSGQFQEDSRLHDDGEKTILGRKGCWKGDDLIRILLEHPATAERLAGRICELLMGEGAVSAAGIHALAERLREHNRDIGWGVETVLRSQAFFADTNLGTRIVGPVEFVVGSVRALELFELPPNTLILVEYAAHLGQDLFHPPNVGGWPGGRSWITTRSVIGRFNFALALLAGDEVGRGERMDVFGLAERHGQGGDLKSIVRFYADLLLGGLPSPAWQEQILSALGPKAGMNPEAGRQAVALILASPEGCLV